MTTLVRSKIISIYSNTLYSMGIRGLTGWIAWAAPAAITSPNWALWKGKRIGIDILGFLYRAKAQRRDPIAFLATFIAALKRYDIMALPIFDGKPPDEKRGALAKRTAVRLESDTQRKTLLADLEAVPMNKEQRTVVESRVRTLEQSSNYLTSEERDIAKQLFYACGILPLNATGEADNALAYFSKHGMIDAVISNDLDLLTRGVSILLVPEPHALPGDTCGWRMYNLNTILKTVDFTYSQFVEMCILMGSDYTYGHKSMPYKAAYWAMKYRGRIESTLAELHILDYTPYKRAYKILVGDSETFTTIMGEKQWEKLASGVPVVERDALATFRKGALVDIAADDYELLFHS